MNKNSLKFAVVLSILFLPSMAIAAAGTALPWEGAINILVASVTGPVAIGAALIAICASGGVLIFQGGEMSTFARTGTYIVLVAGLLVGANNVLQALYGSAAVVPVV